MSAGTRLLVVDADPSGRAMLRDYLEGRGFAIEEAAVARRCANGWHADDLAGRGSSALRPLPRDMPAQFPRDEPERAYRQSGSGRQRVTRVQSHRIPTEYKKMVS